MNVRAVVATLLVALGLAAPAAASSSSAQSVVISPPVCKFDAFPLIPFLDSLRVELAASRLGCCTLADSDDQLSADDGSLHVRIEIAPCVADWDRVQVSAQASADAPAAEREVALSDVIPSARPRALAL